MSNSLPPHLEARATTTLGMMKRAVTRPELERAKADGERLVADINSHAQMKAATDRRLGKSIVDGMMGR